jgi:hypothetical protein
MFEMKTNSLHESEIMYFPSSVSGRTMFFASKFTYWLVCIVYLVPFAVYM